MFLASTLSPLGSTMVAVALPSISAELHVSSGALTQWLVASYLIAGIAAMSPCGKLGDVIGHRRSLMIGMSVYAAGSTLAFVLATLPSLAIARIAMAIGGAMVVPATMALSRNSVPAERLPRTFGFFGSIMGTAAAIGPLIGGELTARFGWRAVFIATLPVIALAYALVRFTGHDAAEAPTTHRARFDIEGSAMLAAALTLIVVASRMKGAGAPIVAILAVALFAAFVWWERRAESPVVDLRLFTRRAFAAGNAVVALHNLAMYSLLFQIPIFFEHVRGIHSGTTGRVIIGMMVAMVVCAPIGGRLSERFGARRIALLGCAISLAGVLVLADFARLMVPRDALLGLTLVGTGLGLATSPSQSSAMSTIPAHQSGMAAGSLSTSRYLGGVLGISVLGALLAADGGAESHRTAALCYAAALVIAGFAALLLPGRIRFKAGTSAAIPVD